MTRWLRFLLIALSAKRRRPVTIADETRLTFRVWPTDCDAAIMNHAAFLNVCEAARLDHMLRSGFFRRARERRWYMPMAAVNVQYRRPVRRFAKLEVVTRIAHWTDEDVWVEQRVLANGKIAIDLIARGVLREGRENVPMTEVVDALWPGNRSPEMSPWIASIKAADMAYREV